MEPLEIVKLYDHIARNGSPVGMHGGRKRTMIANMMMYIDKWKRDGKQGLLVGREDGDEPWGIEFHLRIYERLDTATRSQMFASTRWGAIAQSKTISHDGINKMNPVILRWNGDYEAYRNDFTLLRMFSHEWFDEG